MALLLSVGVDPTDDDDGDGRDDFDCCPLCACGVVLSHGPITFCEFPRYGKILATGVLVLRLVWTDSSDDDDDDDVVVDSGDEFTVGFFCFFISPGGEGSSLGSICGRLDFGIPLSSWGRKILSSFLVFGGDDDDEDGDEDL